MKERELKLLFASELTNAVNDAVYTITGHLQDNGYLLSRDMEGVVRIEKIDAEGNAKLGITVDKVVEIVANSIGPRLKKEILSNMTDENSLDKNINLNMI